MRPSLRASHHPQMVIRLQRASPMVRSPSTWEHPGVGMKSVVVEEQMATRGKVGCLLQKE